MSDKTKKKAAVKRQTRQDKAAKQELHDDQQYLRRTMLSNVLNHRRKSTKIWCRFISDDFVGISQPLPGTFSKVIFSEGGLFRNEAETTANMGRKR